MRIKELRRALGYSQEDMANKLGTTKRVYGSWERGETPLPFDKAIEIAVLFECTTDDLVSGKSEDVSEGEQSILFDLRRMSDESLCFVLDAMEYALYREGKKSTIAYSTIRHPLRVLNKRSTPYMFLGVDENGEDMYDDENI